MNINDQQAKESLEMIQQTTKETKKALNSDAYPWLLLWGGLWMVAYTICHFYGEHGGLIMCGMGIVGSIGSGIIVWWYSTRGPVKTDSKNPMDRKILWFWVSLFIYMGILMKLLSPMSGLQINAVIVITVMLAYVVMGLFYECPFLTIIGAFVTAIAILAYYVFPAYYCLWLAVCGGGTLFGTGVYIKLKWR
jgi:hypothetical protein